jgi:hypothetical protein
MVYTMRKRNRTRKRIYTANEEQPTFARSARHLTGWKWELEGCVLLLLQGDVGLRCASRGGDSERVV